MPCQCDLILILILILTLTQGDGLTKGEARIARVRLIAEPQVHHARRGRLLDGARHVLGGQVGTLELRPGKDGTGR